ncbi:protein phosphatase 2C domain-containing protein, partial [Arsukibacterium sp.]|uniref:protein phosphatase 2C domain-containing protein n=1 Tax=Arsukibacterium sp. TaxID=1977258 RepID=UPI002FDA5131
MHVNQLLLQKSALGGRQYNQDRSAVHVDEASGDIFVVVADGVGGSDNGEVAAQTVVELSHRFWLQRQTYDDASHF